MLLEDLAKGKERWHPARDQCQSLRWMKLKMILTTSLDKKGKQKTTVISTHNLQNFQQL